MGEARYFQNKLTDYKSGKVKIETEEWKKKLLEIMDLIIRNQEIRDNGGGLYTGVGGVAYMLNYVCDLPACAERKGHFLRLGLQYIDAALNYAKSRKADYSKETPFLLGNAGIYAVATALSYSSGNTTDQQNFLKLFVKAGETMLADVANEDELFMGRAGYLAGAVWLRKILKDVDSVPDDLLFPICKAMLMSGREYAAKNDNPCPLMYAYHNAEYIGAAHGLSSILLVLMSVPGALHLDEGAEADVHATVDFILDQQTASGNFPAVCEDPGAKKTRSNIANLEELVQWCHGAPGVVYLMAKAYLRWKDEKYLQSCIKCGDVVWKRGLLKKGPGICHGVAGNAYVFLLLFRLTKEQKHLHRALAFSRFMFTDKFKKEARTPDNPYSLYEGWAGTACFLADLTNPAEAAFPFFDFFK